MDQETEKHSQDFKVFVDEQSDDKEVEEQWQRVRELNRRKQLKRVLIAGAVGIGLLFAILLSVFSHHPAAVVLDNSHPQYSLIQSTMPHLKVMVAKNADTYQVKMMRGIGIVFPELMAWLEGNVNSKMKVLLIPDETSGTALLSMALGYYLGSSPFDVLIKDEQYLDLVKTNAATMKEHHPLKINLNFLTEVSQEYDLIVVENRQYEGKLMRIVGVKQDYSSLDQSEGGYRYQISKGVVDDFVSKVGKWYAYSLVSGSDSSKTGWTSFLLQQLPDPSINLCPEQVPAFSENPHFRNLIEFFRNKTIGTLYYGLEQQMTKETISKFKGIQTVELWKAETVMREGDWAVLKKQVALQRSEKGVSLVVEVSSQAQAEEVKAKLGVEPRVLPGTNSNGCYYPPKLFPFPTACSYPSYLIFNFP